MSHCQGCGKKLGDFEKHRCIRCKHSFCPKCIEEVKSKCYCTGCIPGTKKGAKFAVSLYVIIGIVLFLLSAAGALAEKWYIAGGSTTLNNYSDAMTQGFYYQYVQNASNLTHYDNKCSGSSVEWMPDVSCNVPAFANRTDFSEFATNKYLWFHPVNVTDGAMIKFVVPSLGEYNFNTSFWTANSGSNREFWIRLNSSSGTVIKTFNLSGNKHNFSQYTYNLTFGDYIVFYVKDADGGVGGDSCGIMLNISSRALAASIPEAIMPNGTSQGFMFDVNHSGKYPYVFPDRLDAYNSIYTGYAIRTSPQLFHGSWYFVNDGNWAWKVNKSNISNFGTYKFLGTPQIEDSTGKFTVWNDSLYIGTLNGSLWRFDENLSVLANANYSDYFEGSMAVCNGYLYIGSKLRHYQFYAHNLSIVHSAYTGDNTVSTPTCNGTYAWFTSRTGYLYQYLTPNFTIINIYNTGNVIAGSPVLLQDLDMVSFCGDSNKCYDVNASNITFKLNEYSTGHDVDSALAFNTDYKYFMTGDKRLIQANKSNVGDVKNQYSLYGVGWSDPSLDMNGQICAGDTAGVVYLWNSSNITHANDFANMSDGSSVYNPSKDQFWDFQDCIPYNDTTGYYAVIGSLNGTLFQFYNVTSPLPPAPDTNINASNIWNLMIDTGFWNCSQANNLTAGDQVNVSFTDVNYSEFFTYIVYENDSVFFQEIIHLDIDESPDHSFMWDTTNSPEDAALIIRTNVNDTYYNWSSICNVSLCLNDWYGYEEDEYGPYRNETVLLYIDLNNCSHPYNVPEDNGTIRTPGGFNTSFWNCTTCNYVRFGSYALIDAAMFGIGAAFFSPFMAIAGIFAVIIGVMTFSDFRDIYLVLGISIVGLFMIFIGFFFRRRGGE